MNDIPFLRTTRTQYIFILLCLNVCIFWGLRCKAIHAQDAEKKLSEVRFEESGITITSENIENAKKSLEELKIGIEEKIKKAELSIQSRQSDLKSTSEYLEKLQEEKKAYQEEKEPNQKNLKLLDKQVGIIQEKIKAGNEQIQVYKDYIAALQDQLKTYEHRVVLLESMMKLREIVEATPSEQASMVKKEAEIAKGYIDVARANLKEKETLITVAAKEVEDIKTKTSNKRQELIKELELLKSEIDEEEIKKVAQKKIDSILFWQEKVNTLLVSTYEVKLETSKVRHDVAGKALKNAEYNAAFLVKKAKLLEEKQKAEELKKKQEELEYAKKVEELSKKVAEATRAEMEKTLQEAAEKSEEIAQKKMLATSPEKKRVLELEAELQKQIGLVAKRKDELITDGTQRYKDRTEYKKLEADLGLFLSKAGTAKEIEEMKKKVSVEMSRFSDAANAIETTISSLNQEKQHLSEKIGRANEELSEIKKEVALFEDKELAQKAIEYAQQKKKMQEQQLELIIDRINRLQERLEIKKDAVELLKKTQGKLVQMKAANVWHREESNISPQTFHVLYKDIISIPGKIPALFTIGTLYIKNILAYVNKNIFLLHFWVRIFGLVLLLATFYFSRRYILKWCINKVEELRESINFTYFKTRLFPSLLIIFQKSVTWMWVLILSLSIPAIFQVQLPIITATIYVLLYIAVYKILEGFLVETFSPAKGHRKLIVSFAYISPKQIYEPLKIILKFSVVFLSIITVLTIYNYKTDVLELLWFTYRIVILLLLLWLATQKDLIFKLLPGGESQLGKFLKRLITVIYPVFVFFIISLFAIRSLGYSVFAFVLLSTCIKSIVVAFISFWIWKFLHYKLHSVRQRRFDAINIQKGTPEERKFQVVTSVWSIALNYVIAITSIIFIISIWKSTFQEAARSPAAPYIVQKISENIGIVLDAIAKGMKHRFVFQEGRYTTPLKIVIALIVLFASFFIARYVKTLIETKVFLKLRIERGLKQTFSTLIRYIIISIAILIGLNLAGIPLRSLAFFAGAFGIGIGFGMQNIISNFISGIILLFERPMRVGDVITLEDGTLGTIERISTRSTTIITPDNVSLTVPNSKFVESKITNWSLPQPHMRGKVTVGVAYGSDTALVKKCLLEVAQQNPKVRKYPEPFVRFNEFGDSALIFDLFFWGDDAGARWFAMSELNFSIDEVFRKNNIEIAFPQRDIHIRSMAPSNGAIFDTDKNK